MESREDENKEINASFGTMEEVLMEVEVEVEVDVGVELELEVRF